MDSALSGVVVLRTSLTAPSVQYLVHTTVHSVVLMSVAAPALAIKLKQMFTLIFSRFFDFNFIIQYWLFIFALSYYTMLLCVIWAVVGAVAAFLTLGTHVLLFTHCFFCIC